MLCFFLLLDGPFNNNTRRRETKSQVLYWTYGLEGVQLRKCVKQNKDEKKKKNAGIFWNKTLLIGDVIFIDYPLKYWELLCNNIKNKPQMYLICVLHNKSLKIFFVESNHRNGWLYVAFVVVMSNFFVWKSCFL